MIKLRKYLLQSRQITATQSRNTSQTLQKNYDAVIIGGGHNGLVCANYLAKEKMKVLVLERRHLVGGAAVSEEIYPGYVFSRASYLLSLFRNKVIDDLFPQNWREDLVLYKREYPSFTPTRDGKYLLLGCGEELEKKEISKFSKKDNLMYPLYNQKLEELVDFVNPIIDVAPPQSFSEFVKIASKFRKPKHSTLAEIYQMMLSPCSTVLDQFFESDVLKATLASDGVIGAMSSPYSQGSSYILLHHVMGEIDGKNNWYVVKGGMGSVSNYLAKLATEKGVDIKTNAEVEEIQVHGSKVTGIKLADGTSISAPVVISNATHHVTFNQLIKEKQKIPVAYQEGLKNVSYEGSACKINLVLKDFPQFTSLQHINEQAKHAKTMDEKRKIYKYFQGTLHLNCESMQDIHDSYMDAMNKEVCKRPMVELLIPSVLDPSLNKTGDNNLVCTLFTQYAPRHLKNGDWTQAEKDQYVKNVFSVIEEYAPGFSDLVVHKDVLFPQDLERIFNLTGGNIFHGAISINNLFMTRPTHGYANYNTPFTNLFICGSGQHPGGGVMGSPGRLCALKVLDQVKRRAI